MTVACIAYSAIEPHHGRLPQGARESLERLAYYGYDLVVEVDDIADLVIPAVKLREFDLPEYKTTKRGQFAPTILFDARFGDWKGWRIAMVVTDERHRDLYFDYRNKKRVTIPVVIEPASCPIPTTALVHDPLEVCET